MSKKDVPFLVEIDETKNYFAGLSFIQSWR